MKDERVLLPEEEERDLLAVGEEEERDKLAVGEEESRIEKGLLAVGSEENRDLLAVSFGRDLLAVCEGLFSVSVEREMTPTCTL